MISMSRIEAELGLRQQELFREMERERMLDDAKLDDERQPNPRLLHSPFFAQRFGGAGSDREHRLREFFVR